MTGSSGVPTFRAVVERAVVEVLRRDENPKRFASLLAEELRVQFRAAGYGIHARGACVRVHGPDADHLGRPMTPAEERAVGLVADAPIE